MDSELPKEQELAFDKRLKGKCDRVRGHAAGSVCSVQEGNALAGVRNATTATLRDLSQASERRIERNTKARRMRSPRRFG